MSEHFVKVKAAQSCLSVCGPEDYAVHGILQARTLEWAAFPFSRGSAQLMDRNPGPLHCRRILYQLSYEGSPRTLEWVAYLFSSGSSRPRNQIEVSRWALYILPKASGTFITHGELITGITMPLLIQTRLAVTPTSFQQSTRCLGIHAFLLMKLGTASAAFATFLSYLLI